MTGTGTGAKTKGKTSTRMSTRVEMGAIIERRVEGRESLGTYEVVIDVSRKIREAGRRQRVTSNHSRKIRCPSETIASC